MATKMGQKRTQPKNFHANRPGVPLARVSPKHAKELRGYNKLRGELIEKAGRKSEISGIPDKGSIEEHLECHHILGRGGSRLVNPFGIIVINATEHWVLQDTMSWDHKIDLVKFIEPIRLSQGYKLEDYEPVLRKVISVRKELVE